MRWFFFGSLMDPDVLSIVLGRPLAEHERVPATLHGYTRLVVSEETYPALRPEPGGKVHGLMAEQLSEEDGRRICFFEGEEFRLEEHELELASGERRRAVAFMLTENYGTEHQHWDFGHWRAAYKSSFLEMTEEWMALYGDPGNPDFATLDSQWASARERLQTRRQTG